MDLTFITGILGSLVLVTGAAWPSKKVSHPTKSKKNWLLAIGSFIMLLFSIMGYLAGGNVFFVFLEIFVVIATVLMMLNTNDKLDTLILSITGAVLIGWSLKLFQDTSTIYFTLGLIGVGLGYAFEVTTFRRNLALTLGSALIAYFSFLEPNWIFFWLNAFFALFSGYYLVKDYRRA